MEKRSSFRIAEWNYRVPMLYRDSICKIELFRKLPIPEGVNYEISNLCNVRNKKTGKILKPILNNDGYQRVCLSYNGKQKFYLVHHLMWLAWVGEIPEGMEINHISEDKTDNRICNLNLMTHKENNNWGTRNERASKSLTNHPKKSKSVIQKSLEGEVVRIWPSVREIRRKLGYAHQNISYCCRGGYYVKGKWINITQAYGYIWEYENNDN